MYESFVGCAPRTSTIANKLFLVLLWASFSWTLTAQPAADQPDPPDTVPPAEQEAAAPAEADGAETVTPESYNTPYSAYEGGAYEQALQGFVDQQVENPENPGVALNLGSVHYQMNNFEEADSAFSQAALSADDAVRSQALYNLGNSAYRQGRLQEAVELFKAALELSPDDEDSKFNLEFVRDEIRRRHEEAQKRQQEQQQQGDQQQEGDPQQQGDQQQEGDQQQQGEQQQEGGQPQDSDGDGLPDETERNAPNPTDPENPDTDNDGLPDGQEDQNRNGQLDEGETDPNRSDTDGDGVSDGEEAQQQGEPQEGQGEAQPEEQEGLSPEEAERYLQGLEEGLPDQQRRLPPGSRRSKPEKDW